MIFRILVKIIIAVNILLPLGTIGQVIAPGSVANHCYSTEEISLYRLIDEYRRIKKLPPIPFSRSLSYVARVHAMDLSINRPDFGGCNPHSWSAKGKWKACCYAHDKNRVACMNDKPKEITSYKSKGWEMVYSGGEEAKAIDAFDLWKGMGLSNDYLLNTGKWTKPWKAVGIGFYGDYACVWFGDVEDPVKGFGPCLNDSIPEQLARNDSVKRVIPEEKNVNIDPSIKYYIITGSFSNKEKANNEVKRLKNKGYSRARTMASGDNFRISLEEFATESEAEAALPDLKKLFSGAWVLKPEIK